MRTDEGCVRGAVRHGDVARDDGDVITQLVRWRTAILVVLLFLAAGVAVASALLLRA